MRLTRTELEWACKLAVHPELLRLAHQRLAPHPDSSEAREFYFGFLVVMVRARERYRRAFIEQQAEPVQDRNFKFLLWRNLVVEQVLGLIPDSYHWEPWTGSKLKKSEEAIRADQKIPAKILPLQLASMLIRVERSIEPGLSPLVYLGMEAAGSLTFRLFMDELGVWNKHKGTPARISAIQKLNAYVRAAAEHLATRLDNNTHEAAPPERRKE